MSKLVAIECLKSNYVIISVMGPHAGEDESEIFSRKIKDTKIAGKTFWLMRSYQATPPAVQQICKAANNIKGEVFVIFIEASSSGGSTPTSMAMSASSYSHDGIAWKNLPQGLGPVTGKIDNGAYALVLDQLQLADGVIDLWNYASFGRQDAPIKIQQGASTLCAIKRDMSKHIEKIKSRHRRIIAIGRLSEPYGVWLK